MTQSKFMRCVSFCTAGSYDLNELANSFKNKTHLIRSSRDALHIFSEKKPFDIFIFNYGAFVCWGLTKRQESKWLEYIKQYAIDPLPFVEMDHFCFCYGETVSIDIHNRFKLDIITLDSNNAQIKLAISYGLAQSIKLNVFEGTIQDTVRKNSNLPQEIANRGTVSLSRRAIYQRMGEIFIARSSINLNSEYLDSPEFFWRNPSLESYYVMTKKFLDIPSRVMALNQKLDVLQELLHILNSQIEHRHSTLLEITIILLIAIEIIISLWQYH